ncbi:MAG: LLM class flavin-dependent oxidoreductase [Ilumatobacteraceae bacterium]|nr:LLM class flavin-dependent oxidoreductase [Ilumatobacteraceae bacterium]
MKLRIGYGLGTGTNLHDPSYGVVVDALERLGFDSLWLSEKVSGSAPDPLVAMAYGAGRTSRLKFGMSVMVLPGRNPVLVAKEMATLAVMSGGRLLPAFGLGAVNPVEQQAFGVERGERAALFNEAFDVMRACWSGDPVHHHGARFDFDGVTVQPVPKRMDVWLGGIAPSELRRVGRLADGWLPSFVLPDDAAEGRKVIEETCAEHERSIDDDHYGVLIPYCFGAVPDALVAALAKRRPDLEDPRVLVPDSWDELGALIKRFEDVGTTKFVVVPIVEPGDATAWVEHLEHAAEALLPLEHD